MWSTTLVSLTSSLTAVWFGVRNGLSTPLFITFIFGIFMVLDYFVPHRVVTSIGETLQTWTIIMPKRMLKTITRMMITGTTTTTVTHMSRRWSC